MVPVLSYKGRWVGQYSVLLVNNVYQTYSFEYNISWQKIEYTYTNKLIESHKEVRSTGCLGKVNLKKVSGLQIIFLFKEDICLNKLPFFVTQTRKVVGQH